MLKKRLSQDKTCPPCYCVSAPTHFTSELSSFVQPLLQHYRKLSRQTQSAAEPEPDCLPPSKTRQENNLWDQEPPWVVTLTQ